MATSKEWMEKGYLQNIWNDVHLEEEGKEVTTGLTEKGIDNKEWIDREEQRRKIKLKFQAQKD